MEQQSPKVNIKVGEKEKDETEKEVKTEKERRVEKEQNEKEEEKFKKEKEKRKHEKTEEQNKIDKETKEDQEKVDKVYDILKHQLDAESSLETVFKTLKDDVDSYDESWIQKTDQVTKEAFLNQLRSEVVTNKDFVNRKSLSPSEVISNTSALTGKLFTKNVSEFVEQRKSVLQAHSGIKLMSPRLPQTNETIEFQSRYQRDQFHKCLSTGGWGTAIEITAADKFKGIGGMYGCTSKEQKEKEAVENHSATFFSRLLCSIMPAASWEPQYSDISLSEDALTKLRNIEKYMLAQRDLAKTECERFFTEFGSHVYLRTIHIGGMYKIETNYEPNQTMNMTRAKEMVQTKHSESVNNVFSILGSFKAGIQQSGQNGSGKVNATGTYEKIESSKIHSTETKVGGPQEVSSLPLWKLGLLSNNSTWVVVDGGTFSRDDYTPVWELVYQQSQDFRNASDLICILIETWESTSGMRTSKDDVIKCQINSTEKQMQRELELMTQCLNSEKEASAIARVVCSVCKQIQEMEKNLGNTNLWQDEIQNNGSVSEFLNLVITQDFSTDDEIEVRRCIDRLMVFSENLELPLRQKIHLWLNNRQNMPVCMLTKQTCGNVENFNSILKQFLRSCRVKQSERESYVPHDFTFELGNAVESLIFRLHQKNENSQVLYLYSLLIPLKFDVTKKDFEVPVTVKDLEYLSEKLENGIPQYKDGIRRGTKWLQAWILKGLLSDLLLGSSSKAKHDHSEGTNAISECSKLVKNEKLNISDEGIKSLFDHNWDGDIESLIEKLSFIVDGKDEQCTKTLQWNYFSNKSSTCYIDNKGGFIKKAFHGHPNNETDREGRADLPDLVKILKLSNYFPGRLTVQIALTINNKTPDQSACIEDLPWLMLKAIIAGNFQFREHILEGLQNKITSSSTSDGGKQTDGNLLDLLADSDSEGEMTDSSHTENLHPSDILLVLYECCDACLKGLVAQKMFLCQLAIPLIHKDYLGDEGLVVSLWPLRGIVTTTSNNTEESVVTQETAILSFIRLGESCKLSKSKFLNDILRDQNELHNTFFHRDCKFGMRRRTISDGMLEITWYLPSDERDRHEKQSEEPLAKQIQQPLTVLNMRGDAVKYRDQIDAILCMSRIVVVFVEFEDLKNKRYTNLLTKIHASDPYVILFTKIDQDKTVLKSVIQDHGNTTKMCKSKAYLFSTFDIAKKREYNACEIKERLIRVISDEMTKTKKATNLETAAAKITGKVYCDENNKNCIYGKQLASSIFSPVAEKENDMNRKEIFLPLQGERFWRQWSRLQKENYRSGKNQSDEHKNKIWKEMKSLREAQVNILNSTPDVVASFVETLIEIIDQNETILYFLDWLKHFLDDESRKILPNIRKRLHYAFHDYETKTKKSECQVTYIEECKDSLANASFGLEHVFRELAQIYEAFAFGKANNRNCVSRNTLCLLDILPYLAVKLLLLGQPLELLDGDAANVPQKWIDAVFQALAEVTEDRKVVSISVLGIQSSGKSTLLNTMFGLQLPVSAGRCTRGVFLQLLRICGDSARQGPSYAAIIDTEGLRSPESSGKSMTCDNELATLVIGLADIIIINIKGETMGEMENILQIVVHEMLRLKQAHANLDLFQSVIMVHQNISAQDAASQLDQGNLSILTNLNKVTKEAASQACISGIECFKDVIQFNSKDHVKYIPDLWLGNPPMAPINPRYCSQANEVADTIVHDLINNQQQFLSVQSTSLHFRNLWDAILAEDFVFSFCNGLQIKAYTLLEGEYVKLKFRLEQVTSDWKLDYVKPKLQECKDLSELSKCGARLIDDFRSKLETEKTSVLKEMDDFIRNSDLRQQMAEWQEGKKQRLKYSVDELIRNVQRTIKVEKDHCRVALKQCTVIEQRRKRIYDTATDMAKCLQGEEPSDEEKRRHFQDFWRKEMDEIKLEVEEEPPQIRSQRIKQDIKVLLYNHFETEGPLLGKALIDHPLENPFTLPRLENCLDCLILDKHITVQGNNVSEFVRKRVNKVLGTESKHLANATTFVNLILKEIDKKCTDLLKTDTDYDRTQFSKILFIIKDGFLTHNTADSNKFKLSPALEILVSVHAANFACKTFEKMSSNYHDKHSIIKQLQAYRPSAWRLFEDVLDSKTSEIIAANSLCLEVKDILRERIERKIQNDIVNKIRMQFGNKKHAVIKEVLEELSSLNSFDALSTYISRPEIYVKQWLEKLTNRIVFSKDKKKSYYELQAIGYLSNLITCVKSAVTVTTEANCNNNIEDWVQSFKKLIKQENLVLKFDAFKHVCECGICNFKDFSNCIQEKLGLVEDELTQVFKNHDASTTVWQEKNPHEAIFESLWGCVAKCPFCEEPCIKSDSNHAQDKGDVHRCIQHRPSGIGGVHKVVARTMTMDSCSYMVYLNSKMLCGHWCHCSKVKGNENCHIFHEMRQYQKYRSDWEILPNSDSPSSKYWAWCMVQFSKSLEKKYGVIAPSFPESWISLTKEDALDSLDVYT